MPNNLIIIVDIETDMIGISNKFVCFRWVRPKKSLVLENYETITTHEFWCQDSKKSKETTNPDQNKMNKNLFCKFSNPKRKSALIVHPHMDRLKILDKNMVI